MKNETLHGLSDALEEVRHRKNISDRRVVNWLMDYAISRGKEWKGIANYTPEDFYEAMELYSKHVHKDLTEAYMNQAELIESFTKTHGLTGVWNMFKNKNK